MPTAPIGPCVPWITPDEILGCGSCKETVLSRASTDQIDQAIQIASDALYARSGRTFSTCTETLRPCCRSNLGGFGRFRQWGWSGGWGDWSNGVASVSLVAGQWYNSLGCSSPCVVWECGQRVPRIDLGRDYAPITAVTEVKIDGAVLDPSAYRVEEERYLVRLDGALWPVANNILEADTEAGTWSVAVEYGFAPPALGIAAASELACNMLLSVLGDEDCALPKRAVSANRAGISFTLQDIFTIIDKGGIGLYLCDLFIETYNPEHLASEPRVVNIDRLPATRFP